MTTILSRNTLAEIGANAAIPDERLFTLPETVLQFGTGVLLRGLTDYYIDKANAQGVFNGRIVVVKSTSAGSTDEFAEQDNLYTLYIKGIEHSKHVESQNICAGISRVLTAATQWHDILNIARSKELKVVISNTTEAGLQLTEEDIFAGVPASFPGKLLAVLYERYLAFNGSSDAGLVIIPTELLIDNGTLLKNILLKLAAYNNMQADFISWMQTANRFCNSLVDRIVPGNPDAEMKAGLEEQQDYIDNLSIVAEPYNLWAIEGDEQVKQVLSFAEVDENVIITPDIEQYREMKLRLLNAPHSLCCAIALLAGFKTVNEAMVDDAFNNFINKVIFEEIIPSLSQKVNRADAGKFAARVLDRFRNPYIKHQWQSIAMQYSTKLKSRVVPLLLSYHANQKQVPRYMALSFAAFILLMKPGTYQFITDSNAGVFDDAWQKANVSEVVISLLANTSLWDADLTRLEGFADAVSDLIRQITEQGMRPILSQYTVN